MTASGASCQPFYVGQILALKTYILDQDLAQMTPPSKSVLKQTPLHILDTKSRHHRIRFLIKSETRVGGVGIHFFS